MMNMVSSRLRNANYCALGFSIDAGFDELIAGSCTSCQVTQDKSSYWTPALYFQDASGKMNLVDQVGGMLAYVISPICFNAFLLRHYQSISLNIHRSPDKCGVPFLLFMTEEFAFR